MINETVNQPSSPEPTRLQTWGENIQPVFCPACKSSLLISGQVSGDCPVCFSDQLQPLNSISYTNQPELEVPYKLEENSVSNQLSNWIRGVWLRSTDLNEKTLSSRVKRLLIPMWLVDGSIRGPWQAQMGYEYQVASSTEAYSGGQWSTHRETETRLRWEPRLGTVDRSYQNLAVAAMDDHEKLISGLGKYALRDAVAFSNQLMKNASVRLPNLSIQQAWPFAQTQFLRAAAQDCQTAASAQRIDQYKIQAEYSELNWTLLLLPAFSTFYHDDHGNIHPVLINGQTGNVFGQRWASQSLGWQWTGILAGIGLACVVLALLSSLLVAVLPFVIVLSTVLFIIGAIGLLASPFPAIWAWQFNRANQLD